MQEALFYGFSLERHVPDDHLLRKIDRFADLSEVRPHLGPYYTDVGRPSIDPKPMMRMLSGVAFRPDRGPAPQRIHAALLRLDVGPDQPRKHGGPRLRALKAQRSCCCFSSAAPRQPSSCSPPRLLRLGRDLLSVPVNAYRYVRKPPRTTNYGFLYIVQASVRSLESRLRLR
jgi:hypothetical protein